MEIFLTKYSHSKSLLKTYKGHSHPGQDFKLMLRVVFPFLSIWNSEILYTYPEKFLRMFSPNYWDLKLLGVIHKSHPYPGRVFEFIYS